MYRRKIHFNMYMSVCLSVYQYFMYIYSLVTQVKLNKLTVLILQQLIASF